MLFPDRRRRRARATAPDPELVVSSGDDQAADVEPTPAEETISLDALLADPTPDPGTSERPRVARSAASADNVISPPRDRTYVLQSVGVGEVPVPSPADGGEAPASAGSVSGSVSGSVTYTGSSAGLLLHIPVDSIQPNEFQPRRRFDEDALVSLTESVRELGVLQPILVRRLAAPSGGRDSAVEFELVAGERRWRAARRAGLAKLPAIVRDVSDLRSLEEAIVENLHRADLNPLEEAAAYQQLVDEFGLSQAQVAQRVGKSRSAVANTLRLVQLPVSVQRLVVAGELSAGHARAVLAVPSFDQPEFAGRIVSEQLSVRQAEELAQNWSEARRGGSAGRRSSDRSDRSRGDGSDVPKPDSRSAGALEAERLLQDRLDTRVRVDETARGGRITIDFADSDDLDRIFGLISGPDPA